jgi:hypothetical protein
MKIGVSAWILAVAIASGCGRGNPLAPAEVAPPPNWPIAGLTLPAGTHDAEFNPGPLSELSDRLPRKQPFGTSRYVPPPPQWDSFFAFTGEPAKVFDHVDKFLAGRKFVATEIQDLDVGTPSESRSHTYTSRDKSYSVSIRYWKISDLPGARPYQLLIRDLRTQYHP